MPECTDVFNVDLLTEVALKDITCKCKPCKTRSKASRRFKFALGKHKVFSSKVFIDISYVCEKSSYDVINEPI